MVWSTAELRPERPSPDSRTSPWLLAYLPLRPFSFNRDGTRRNVVVDGESRKEAARRSRTLFGVGPGTPPRQFSFGFAGADDWRRTASLRKRVVWQRAPRGHLVQWGSGMWSSGKHGGPSVGTFIVTAPSGGAYRWFVTAPCGCSECVKGEFVGSVFGLW